MYHFGGNSSVLVAQNNFLLTSHLELISSVAFMFYGRGGSERYGNVGSVCDHPVRVGSFLLTYMMHLVFLYVHPVGHKCEKNDGSLASLMHVDAGAQR